MENIKNYLLDNLQGLEFIGDLCKENGFYYFNVRAIADLEATFENKIYEVASIDYGGIDCYIELKVEANFLELAAERANMKSKNKNQSSNNFRTFLANVDLDDILPIASDVIKDRVGGNIWRINLGNIGKKFSPTGKLGYLPFQVRYKTEERAKEIRLEILRAIYNIIKMEKIKCITFDKKAQDNLPQHIKDKMKDDRDKARKKMNGKNLTIPVVMDSVCPECGGSPVEKININNHCPYCDHNW